MLMERGLNKHSARKMVNIWLGHFAWQWNKIEISQREYDFKKKYICGHDNKAGHRQQIA